MDATSHALGRSANNFRGLNDAVCPPPTKVPYIRHRLGTPHQNAKPAHAVLRRNHRAFYHRTFPVLPTAKVLAGCGLSADDVEGRPTSKTGLIKVFPSGPATVTLPPVMAITS